MLLDKSDLPQVAIDEMNRTHENEIDLINHLFELISEPPTTKSETTELASVIEKFAAHVETHFAREEEMMRDVSFPAYRVHKGEHDRVRAELFSIIDQWRNDGELSALHDYLKNTHPVWAKNHIATMDAMTAMYIKQAQCVS